MTQPVDIGQVRRAIRAALGDKRLAELHRGTPLGDALVALLVLGAVVGCALALGSLPFGVLWVLLFLLQGFFLQMPGLVIHDLFVHRRVGGEAFSSIIRGFLALPLFVSPTAYEAFHLEHHRYIGTEQDSEGYKQRVDTPLKRLALATTPGFYLQHSWPFRDELLTPGRRRKLTIERRLFVPMALVWALFFWLWPSLVLFGFWLPALVTLPLAAVFRIVLEHSEADAVNNPFHVAIFYRTGLLTRLLLLWGGGDCHLIHHIYPTIPCYKAGRAADLIRPILVAHGVIERTSLLQIFKGYFIKSYPHRTRWPAEL